MPASKLNAFIALLPNESNSTVVADIGLARIKHLTALTQINIPHARVTHVGFVALKKLKLTQLSHNGTGVTDAGIELLKTQTALTETSFFRRCL